MPHRGLKWEIPINIDGRLVGCRSSQEEEKETALFISPHAIVIDSRGDICSGEVCWGRDGVNRRQRPTKVCQKDLADQRN